MKAMSGIRWRFSSRGTYLAQLCQAVLPLTWLATQVFKCPFPVLLLASGVTGLQWRCPVRWLAQGKPCFGMSWSSLALQICCPGARARFPQLLWTASSRQLSCAHSMQRLGRVPVPSCFKEYCESNSWKFVQHSVWEKTLFLVPGKAVQSSDGSCKIGLCSAPHVLPIVVQHLP